MTVPSYSFTPQVFTQRVNLYRTSAEAAQLLKLAAPVIGSLARALEGIDGVRVWHDQALLVFICRVE
jgi:hypothetical protein